jgi:RimJ/RimL family protein N-acetyltransferase
MESRVTYAVIDIGSGRAAGTASYLNINLTAGSIEVGSITYAPALQRKPAGSEAMFLMMRRVFDELGYRRYEWKCNSLNAPSRAAALRYGFRFEGIFRQAGVVKGHNRDTAWFSIIDSEWPSLKAAFERWLDPTNFAADGEQRLRLSELTRA